MEQLLHIVGTNIRTLRKQQKMTQADLAEKCEPHTSYLAQTERGERNITLQTLEITASGLGVQAQTLLDLDSPIKHLSSETDQLVNMFSNQLKVKSEQEIKLIIDIAQKIFETYK